MYFTSEDRRRRAVWRIIRSSASDEAKAGAFEALTGWRPRHRGFRAHPRQSECAQARGRGNHLLGLPRFPLTDRIASP